MCCFSFVNYRVMLSVETMPGAGDVRSQAPTTTNILSSGNLSSFLIKVLQPGREVMEYSSIDVILRMENVYLGG